MSTAGTTENTEVSIATKIAQKDPAAFVRSEDVGDEKASSNTGNSGITASQPPEKSKGKICGVCNDHEARYKCSRCQLPYCSVACATLHRATHPPVSDDAPPTTVVVESSITTNGLNLKPIAGTISATRTQNPFSVLEDAKELQTLFMMYPRLRSQLREIYAATLPPLENPSGSVSQYENHPQVQRGRGRGRGRIGTRGERGPWNSDRGTQDGIDALSNGKEQYGKGGEGVREYAELVLKLVSIEGVDVAQLVQEEVAEENAQIIAQLLNGNPF